MSSRAQGRAAPMGGRGVAVALVEACRAGAATADAWQAVPGPVVLCGEHGSAPSSVDL